MLLKLWLFKQETNTACSFDQAITHCSAVNSCEYLRINWGEIAAFDLTITVSSSFKDSPQVTLFNATQMAQLHNKSFASVSHLVCKMASYQWESCSVTARYEENLNSSDCHLKLKFPKSLCWRLKAIFDIKIKYLEL